MRVNYRCLLLGVAVALGGCSSMNADPKVAGHPMSPTCDGRFAYLRIDAVTPGGTIAGVEKAARDQQAWYRANGYQDNDVFAIRVMGLDKATDTFVNRDDRIVTLHVNPPNDAIDPERGVGRSDDDKATWAAFVKEYDDNSKILTTIALCLPKLDR